MTEDKNATEEKPKKTSKSSTSKSKSKSSTSKSKSSTSKSKSSTKAKTSRSSRSKKKDDAPKEEAAAEAAEAAETEETVEAKEEAPKKKSSRSRSKKKDDDKAEAKAEDKAEKKSEKKAEPKKKLKSWRPKDRLKAGEKWLGELFTKMQLEGIEVEGNVGDKVLEYNVHGGDAHLLLGTGKASAKALESIQTILRETLVNGYDTKYEVHLDVDNFRQRRTEHLEAVATGLAEAAKRVGTSITVAGFNSFERRVVHQALSESKAVTTDSEGRGSFRKLRVDPR